MMGEGGHKPVLFAALSAYIKRTVVHDMYAYGCSTQKTMHSFIFITAAGKDANSLFDDIIRRKDKADATRNVLGIMNRFKFLFYLPPTIR